MEQHNRKRVCVVGAGIAGLVTAKVLQDDGFDVVVFERDASIGGVWAASRTYPGLRANNPRETYAFSDFPYPDTADDYPTAEQVRTYLESYTDHFGIRPRIRLSTEVVSVAYTPAGSGSHSRFQVTVQPTDKSEAPQKLYFDFAVICNGVFSQPYLPTIEGQALFAGQVLHSSQLADAEVVAGKRVVVVGASKSALDCATWASEHAQTSTLIFRAPHWMVPRYFAGGVRLDRLMMTRFSELFVRYHHPSRLEKWLHGPGKPLIQLWWRGQSQLMPRLLKMPPEMVPSAPMPAGFESVGVAPEFYDALRQGKLAAKRARITAFTGEKTLKLDTGEQIEADVVICATGWRQSIPFLDPELHRLVLKEGQFHLYRHILSPDEPHLGFIGYASSLACQFTSEIGAHWLSQHFRGELMLPSNAEMKREIAHVHQWLAEVFPTRKEGYFIGQYLTHYIDDLVRDMGLPTSRTKNVLAEYFLPFWPQRYQDLAKERQQARSAKPTPTLQAAPDY
jgi:cation diffusion facilitator CzcD-associated flavoprotein CzcO